MPAITGADKLAIVPKILLAPNIVPKFFVPKYSLKIGDLSGVIPLNPKPYTIAKMIINEKELCELIREKIKIPIPIRAVLIAIR